MWKWRLEGGIQSPKGRITHSFKFPMGLDSELKYFGYLNQTVCNF